jgi:predicted ATPase
MEFRLLSSKEWVPDSGNSTVYLKVDNWNDYSFVTMFHMSVYDENGKHHDIGGVKIGFKGQTIENDTYEILPKKFTSLSDGFFSLGQTPEFYKKMTLLSVPLRCGILALLKDVVYNTELIESIRDEAVFSTSLLRNTSISIIKGQYARLLEGKAELTDFDFKYVRPSEEKMSGIELEFSVEVDSKPSTNIHALIGRNGVGKTTILNGMIEAITSPESTLSRFFDKKQWGGKPIDKDYFSSLVSVSFSAFDPFIPPQEQPNPAKGTCYFYIGLKSQLSKDSLRTIDELHDDCVIALTQCFHDVDKTSRWIKAIDKLGSDDNFSAMGLLCLEQIFREIKEFSREQSDSDYFKKEYKEKITPFLARMSSGHAIVFLTISRLVATVDEKTLVLLDEPESHLHPPLLSALIRSLADLLHDRNGLAIIATHSPVVLQEIPSSCIWKVNRIGMDVKMSRPTIESFGENVGVLTKEVFGLEVVRSGFYGMLSKSVEKGMSYDDVLSEYSNKLGFEARAILKALIAHRDGAKSNDKA